MSAFLAFLPLLLGNWLLALFEFPKVLRRCHSAKKSTSSPRTRSSSSSRPTSRPSARASANSPIVAMPCGFTSGGLPVGLQIVAHRLREDLAVQVAAAYEAAHPEHIRRPEIEPAQALPIPAVLPTPGLVMSR